MEHFNDPLEVVAPYLVDGMLTIKYEISEVEEAPIFLN
jgi:hypothetical protein